MKVLGVRFRESGKIYYYEPYPDPLAPGDKVVVDSSSGEELATVVFETRNVPDGEISSSLKPIERKATSVDLEAAKTNAARALKVLPSVKKKVRELKLDMSVSNVDFSLDGSRAIVNFVAENRVDFRELLKELSGMLKKKIELRQIGPRDETKILGGVGACGQACCCKRFLGEFEHVSVKMAKNQGLSLNPAKISGLCGRLMCCLGYENEFYANVLGQCPKIGAQVRTKDGEGTVSGIEILKEKVRVKIQHKDETQLNEYDLSEIVRVDSPHTKHQCEEGKNCGNKQCPKQTTKVTPSDEKASPIAEKAPAGEILNKDNNGKAKHQSFGPKKNFKFSNSKNKNK